MAAQKQNLRRPPSETSNTSNQVRGRGIWQSYAVLPAKTRLQISIAICAVAVAGIFISDELEKWIPSSSLQQAQDTRKIDE